MPHPTSPCPDDPPIGSYRTEQISHLDEHLRWMRKCGRAPSTLRARAATLTRLAEHLEHDPAGATYDELDRWQDTLPSQQAIRHYTQMIRPYYRWLHARGYRLDDPAATLATPGRPARLPRPIEETDLMTVVQMAPDRLRPWLLLAGWCGLRAGEIASLTVAQFRADLSGRVWMMLSTGVRVSEACALDLRHVRRERDTVVVDVIRKGGRPQRLVLPSPAATALQAWVQVRPRRGSAALFMARGLRLHRRRVNEMVERLAAAAGCDRKITPHSLRHTAATLAFECGASLRDVQTLLGHANPRHTQRYDHARHTLQHSASIRLADALAAATEDTAVHA